MWHKNCGGTVKYQMPMVKANFEQAGKCSKCGVFPIIEEDIIFRVEEGFERFSKEHGWIILSEKHLKETLQKEVE